MEITRRWVVEDVPGEELLGAFARAYLMLDALGEDLERFLSAGTSSRSFWCHWNGRDRVVSRLSRESRIALADRPCVDDRYRICLKQPLATYARYAPVSESG